MKPSPFAPSDYDDMPHITGVNLSVCAAELHYRNRPDLLWMEFAPDTSIAGVTTRSTTAGAPVSWCRQLIDSGTARGLVVNAGNANAFTGPAGHATVAQTAASAATIIGCAPEEIAIASTGVIGAPLDPAMITTHLPRLAREARAGETDDTPGAASASWAGAAAAIMTTDTYPKYCSRTVKLADGAVRINGIAKGSGMIAPNMATMLAFIVTDLAIPAASLQAIVSDQVATSFNAITVDSDTSTSDTLLVFATGQAKNCAPFEQLPPEAQQAFTTALGDVMHTLAMMIVRDGEGASKFVEVTVQGARDSHEARTIAMSIANSPLVKTALAGSDPNWGRIIAAVGKTGIPFEQDKLKLWFGDLLVAEKGGIAAGYTEAAGLAHCQRPDISIRLDLGQGTGQFTAWTTDLTHDYIAINADYRS